MQCERLLYFYYVISCTVVKLYKPISSRPTCPKEIYLYLNKKHFIAKIVLSFLFIVVLFRTFIFNAIGLKTDIGLKTGIDACFVR